MYMYVQLDPFIDIYASLTQIHQEFWLRKTCATVWHVWNLPPERQQDPYWADDGLTAGEWGGEGDQDCWINTAWWIF